MDPLTAAVLTLKEIREMTVRDAGGPEAVAAAVRGQDAALRPDDQHPERDQAACQCPLDPALAIVNRFGKLAE